MLTCHFYRCETFSSSHWALRSQRKPYIHVWLNVPQLVSPGPQGFCLQQASCWYWIPLLCLLDFVWISLLVSNRTFDLVVLRFWEDHFVRSETSSDLCLRWLSCGTQLCPVINCPAVDWSVLCRPSCLCIETAQSLSSLMTKPFSRGHFSCPLGQMQVSVQLQSSGASFLVHSVHNDGQRPWWTETLVTETLYFFSSFIGLL